MVADRLLSSDQNAFKWAVVDRIQALGYQPEIFYNPRTVDGIAARKSWTPAEAEEVIRQCVAGVIIGMPRWRLGEGQSEFLLATEYAQYEGAVLRTVNIPIMILAQENLFQRGVFEYNFGQFICKFPESANEGWLETQEFKQTLNVWLADIKDRRDVFLGYCSSSASTAYQLREYVETQLGATVLDWKRDFSVARSVLEEIIEAGKRCSGAIFLFTKDDILSEEPSEPKRRWFKASQPRAEFAIPRDNVVFEAGYFIGIKGKRKVLVVREQGAKMPADLGGDVYAALEDRHNIDSIRETLRRFTLGL
jgi:Predicted nucleotide-binding protein containing TIR-like domain